jgi:hypothetical protein
LPPPPPPPAHYPIFWKGPLVKKFWGGGGGGGVMYAMTLFCLSEKCGLPAKIYFFSWFVDFFLPFFVFIQIYVARVGVALSFLCGSNKVHSNKTVVNSSKTKLCWYPSSVLCSTSGSLVKVVRAPRTPWHGSPFCFLSFLTFMSIP